jgi:hypothetical protein
MLIYASINNNPFIILNKKVVQFIAPLFLNQLFAAHRKPMRGEKSPR